MMRLFTHVDFIVAEDDGDDVTRSRTIVTEHAQHDAMPRRTAFRFIARLIYHRRFDWHIAARGIAAAALVYFIIAMNASKPEASAMQEIS